MSCRFDLLEYIASKANEQSKNYEYFVTRENIKRIDKDGNIEIVLATSQNRAKANYFFELEVFMKQGFYNVYKNLEDYYEQNGYEPVTPLTPMQLIKLQMQSSDNQELLKWLSEVK